MSQQLISHSTDLKRLRDEGYEIAIRGGFLLLGHVPYVNGNREIKLGTLVSELTMSGEQTVRPGNHLVFFQGEHPCDRNGNLISGISHQSKDKNLFENFIINHSFSSKPSNGYNDYYEKMTTYVSIISAPAKSLDSSITAKTFRVILDDQPSSVFQYIDSNSSRANINIINEKLSQQKIAIVGLGGTGSYILDLVAKSPVAEIHLFDGDEFLQHNAFRSPGAATIEVLNHKQKKVVYYQNLYLQMHKQIFSHEVFVTVKNFDLLKGMTFVFIAIDNGSIKKELIHFLLSYSIPFIDVGIGVSRLDDSLIAMVRVTTGTADKNDHLHHRISMVDEEDNNVYGDNVQIAELNCLNAALAVLKWKKMAGFYNDQENEHHTVYSVNVSKLYNEDHSA